MPDSDARVVVAGSSGLIGGALVAALRADGVPVTRLVRREATAPDEVSWDPQRSRLDPAVLAGARAVVGLGGASIGHFPWTRRYKHELLWSRLAPTQALAAAVRALGAGPSARVALLRTAPVVHAEGVLKPLMLLTRLGLSGPLGLGTQVWPWISLDDEVRAIRHVIDGDLEGPVNLTGPTRATANDLGFALARRMNRPFLLRAPGWALRLALGPDAADALLLSDMPVVPERLEASGFSFTHPTVEDAVAAAVPAA